MTKEKAGTLRFVLLEDDSSDAELIQLELTRDGFQTQCRVVRTEDELRTALKESSCDLVLADYTLPGFDGITALKIVTAEYPDIPFIFVSGSLGEERAIEALKSGATDYVLKDHLQRLPSVVKRALAETRDRAERRRMEATLDAQRVLLGTIIDNLPDVVYALDREGRLTIANRALLEAVGRKREELIGKKLSEVWNDERAIDMDAQNETTLRTGRAATDQERASISPDGEVHWFVQSHLPLKDHGSVVGLVCTSSEVTARRALEQEILEISNREQRRLGSDLHDGLGQELTGLSLLLKGLEVQVSRERPDYQAQIQKIADLMAHAIQSTRSLARGLAPVNLERGGLTEALKHLIARCRDMYGLVCTYSDAGQKLPDIEEGAATHLYRIAQEATTNAARYARAKNISVEVRTTGRRLQLIIADDGIGLSAGLAKGSPGMGLKIMEYRARMLGGVVSFEEPGVGTRVVLSAPLRLLRTPKEKLRKAI